MPRKDPNKTNVFVSIPNEEVEDLRTVFGATTIGSGAVAAIRYGIWARKVADGLLAQIIRPESVAKVMRGETNDKA